MDDMVTGLEAHERECAVRYKHIEERLVDGSEKFNQIQSSIAGLYALIITGGLAILGVLSTLAFSLV